MELRDYQLDIATRACSIVKSKGLVYLSMQVRTGKTLTALETARMYGAKRVLFITKIKAFSSIQGDYDKMGYTYELKIINKESVHKLEDTKYDFIVLDEAHQYGAMPKAGKYQKIVRKLFRKLPMIFLSGTMSPESYSQVYHQFQISDRSPFSKYTTFYKWAVDYVDVFMRNIGYSVVKDYTNARYDKIMQAIEPYMITFTQEEANFTTTVEEEIIEIDMKPITYEIIRRLKKDAIVKGSSGNVIIADTAVKMQQKIHQLGSGTIKHEDGSYQVIDTSKADYIKWRFKGNKIGIFYKYKAELEMLRQVIGAENLTQDVDEFNTTNKWIALQYVSGREGINLSKADFLVMFSIDFSATTFFQAIDRMTTINRTHNKVYWLFSKNTLDKSIYKAVTNKKSYTLNYFKKEFGIKK